MQLKENKILKEFIQYVTSNVCGMIGLSCYILADTFFVANGLGANGLAALNLAIPVYSFIHGSGLMLGMGGATKYSIFKGQKHHKQADNIFTNAICLTVVFAIIFVLMGTFLSETLTSILGADRAIYDMTKTYLQVILLFSPAFLMNDVLICFVRNDGAPGLAMAAMLTGSMANILLDYIFIFPMQMGILGAVLATGAAPVISICILSKHWLTKRNNFHLRRLRFSPDLTKNIFSLGLPSLVTEVASGIVIIVFNFLMLRLLGNTGVAAYGIVANLSLVVTSIYTGIAQGTQPITSRAYGFGNRQEQKRILTYAMITVMVLSCCIYLAFLLNAASIVQLFNNSQNLQLQQTAVYGLKLYFTAIPFVGFNIVISTHFTSTERALPAQAVSLARGCFLIIPLAFFLSYVLEMTGVWLSYPITEGIVSIMGVILYKNVFRLHVVK